MTHKDHLERDQIGRITYRLEKMSILLFSSHLDIVLEPSVTSIVMKCGERKRTSSLPY